MNLLQLKIIDKLVHNQCNVSMAAERLYRVQSAISHQLKLLEEEFGSPLFERRGKRLKQPTAICRQLLPHVESILQAERNIKSIAKEFADQSCGELKIATTHTQARYFLPAAIGAFRHKYPNVRLTFFQGNPSEFAAMLRRGDIDFAVFSGEQEHDSSLASTRCYQWNHVLITRRDHPLAKRRRWSLSTIAAYPIITYMPGFTERNVVQQAFSDAGLNINITCSAGDTEIIKTYVELDLGIGIVAQMAYDYEQERDLLAWNLDHLFTSSITCVVHLKDQVLRGYMHDFVKILRAQGKIFQKQLKTLRSTHG